MIDETTGSKASPGPKRRFGVATLGLVALLSAAVATSVTLLLPQAWRAGARGRAGTEHAAPGGGAAVLYQCPMHPSIVQDHPGACPICGMKLLLVDKVLPLEQGRPQTTTPTSPTPPQDASGHQDPAGLVTVEIDPRRQQLIGLQTTEVREGPVGGSWRTVARVAIDETRVRRVNLKVAGFVERVYANFIGKRVQRGDPLFTIYSPELLATQQDYLLALKTRRALASGGGAAESDGDALVAAARRRLTLWDVPATELDRLASTLQPTRTLTIYSPVAGVVTKKDLVEGMPLAAGATPYEIVDLSTVWVLAEVYESELRFVKEGMRATLTLHAFPGRVFESQVLFIDPLLDPQTRTVKVRLTAANPTLELRPELFGEVVLHATPRRGLSIPPDALIDAGGASLVFVALGDGRFQPRELRLGERDAASVEVISGLVAGEHVVTRANFLIDSESRLRAALVELSAGAPPGPRAHPP
jgi:Cu(I)/Ag(I) efflux system membrane fusion protein